MGSVDWSDAAAFPRAARERILATLMADAARDVRAGRPANTDRADTIRAIQAANTLDDRRQTAPTSVPGTKPGRRATRPRSPGIDVGDLFEPTTHARQENDRRIIVLLDTIETVNDGPAHPMQLHTIEARWMIKARDTCLAAALEPLHGPVDVSWWILRERGPRHLLYDVDAAAHPMKGALDGIVHADVIVDDGPGYVARSIIHECRWADVNGLVIMLEPAGHPTGFPLVTVPHRN